MRVTSPVEIYDLCGSIITHVIALGCPVIGNEIIDFSKRMYELFESIRHYGMAMDSEKIWKIVEEVEPDGYSIHNVLTCIADMVVTSEIEDILHRD